MPALTALLDPYTATQIAPYRGRGLWAAMMAAIDGDALVLPPDPVSDARVEEIHAEEARRAMISYLATL
jgi:hypothetical protein